MTVGRNQRQAGVGEKGQPVGQPSSRGENWRGPVSAKQGEQGQKRKWVKVNMRLVFFLKKAQGLGPWGFAKPGGVGDNPPEQKIGGWVRRPNTGRWLKRENGGVGGKDPNLIEKGRGQKKGKFGSAGKKGQRENKQRGGDQGGKGVSPQWGGIFEGGGESPRAGAEQKRGAGGGGIFLKRGRPKREKRKTLILRIGKGGGCEGESNRVGRWARGGGKPAETLNGGGPGMGFRAAGSKFPGRE